MRDSNPRPSAWEADVLPGWTNAAQKPSKLCKIKDLAGVQSIVQAKTQHFQGKHV